MFLKYVLAVAPVLFILTLAVTIQDVTENEDDNSVHDSIYLKHDFGDTEYEVDAEHLEKPRADPMLGLPALGTIASTILKGFTGPLVSEFLGTVGHMIGPNDASFSTKHNHNKDDVAKSERIIQTVNTMLAGQQKQLAQMTVRLLNEMKTQHAESVKYEMYSCFIVGALSLLIVISACISHFRNNMNERR